MKSLYIILLLTFGLGQDYSLEFDGVGDYANLDMQPNFWLGHESFTFNLWFNIQDVERGFQTIFGTNENCGYGANFNHSNTGRMTYWLSSCGCAGCGWDLIDGQFNHDNAALGVKQDWESNKWYMLTAIKNGSQYSFYIDGELDYMEDASDSFLSIDFILAAYANGGECFEGKIDNVSLYQEALTAEEISTLYINNSIDSSNIISSWNFNVENDGVVYDLIGNNNGTLYGDVVYSSDVPIFFGCTDPCMENYNPEVNFDDGSCGEFIGCPDNGDYSLNFDGEDDYVYMGSPEGMEAQGSHTFMFSFKNNTMPCEFGGLIGVPSDDFGTNGNLHYAFRGCETDCPDGNCMGMDFYSNNLYSGSHLSDELTHWVLTYNSNSLVRKIYKNAQ